jgi:single-strand DNA-binding protein
MASFNKVLLMGNLTRAPEVRYTPGGQAVCDIGLAVNRKYSVNGQDREDVCFVDIVVWARQAESCGKYLQKGSPVFVEGRLQYDTWEDKEGRKRNKLRVTAERVQFLSSKSDDSRQSYKPESYDNNNYSQSRHNQPSHPDRQSNEMRNPEPNTNRHFQQNQPINQSTPMPPPPEVFDNETEPEDDIPF